MNPIRNVLINKQQQQTTTTNPQRARETTSKTKQKYTTKLLGNLFKTLIKFKLNSV